MAVIQPLLLAAGQSRRFGSNKLLANCGGQPLLRHSLAQLQGAFETPVNVVLGHQAERLVPLLNDTPWIHNPDYAQGMGLSIATGIRALWDHSWDAVLIALADQAALTRDDYLALSAPFVQNGQPCCARYDGHLGAPALFPRALAELLMHLDGDQGARAWLAQLPKLVAVDLPNAALDIDTPADRVHLVRPLPLAAQ